MTDNDKTELAAFHHDADMTETVWFLVRFFIITTLIAFAFLGGVIALVVWIVQ